jgi:hypothetical protein
MSQRFLCLYKLLSVVCSDSESVLRFSINNTATSSFSIMYMPKTNLTINAHINSGKSSTLIYYTHLDTNF